MPRIATFVLAVLLLGFAAGGAYEKAIKSGIEKIPPVAEFNRLFPEARNFISYYNGEAGPLTWNSVAGLHGRYQLTVQLQISLNDSRTAVMNSKEPLIIIEEVTKITEDAKTGVTNVETQGLDREISMEDWKKVVEAKGDFSVIGINLIKNKPVEGFAKYWRGK